MVAKTMKYKTRGFNKPELPFKVHFSMHGCDLHMAAAIFTVQEESGLPELETPRELRVMSFDMQTLSQR